MTVPAATMPESTYGLLASSARTWPDAVATQWIRDPVGYTRCQAWTYAELAGTVTRIANGLARLGIRREDAVTVCGPNSSGLLAATLAAQAAGIAAPVSPALGADRIAGLLGRTGSPVLIAAGPEADPGLWRQLTAVARQARMRAVIALRPDGATGVPPALDAGPGLPVMYLDELAAGQPAGSLSGIRPPGAADLAAFVHTGGTTGAPKIAAHTHANQLACARGIAESSGLAPGEGVLAGLPLFHVNALIVTGIAPLYSGARVVWPGPAGYRDPALYARFWKIIEHYQIAAITDGAAPAASPGSNCPAAAWGSPVPVALVHPVLAGLPVRRPAQRVGLRVRDRRWDTRAGTIEPISASANVLTIARSRSGLACSSLSPATRARSTLVMSVIVLSLPSKSC